MMCGGKAHRTIETDDVTILFWGEAVDSRHAGNILFRPLKMKPSSRILRNAKVNFNELRAFGDSHSEIGGQTSNTGSVGYSLPKKPMVNDVPRSLSF